MRHKRLVRQVCSDKHIEVQRSPSIAPLHCIFFSTLMGVVFFLYHFLTLLLQMLCPFRLPLQAFIAEVGGLMGMRRSSAPAAVGKMKSGVASGATMAK